MILIRLKFLKNILIICSEKMKFRFLNFQMVKRSMVLSEEYTHEGKLKLESEDSVFNTFDLKEIKMLY